MAMPAAAAVAAFPFALLFQKQRSSPPSRSLILGSWIPPPPRWPSRLASSSRTRLLVLVASSSAYFDDELNGSGKSDRHDSKKSILSNLIQEIEPLDVSLIQKDVPADTVEAMKRTISSMLGLLPSDHFNVLVEAFWEPLFKLFVSSMTTGYTLRNAEYRLCLEKNLGICGGQSAQKTQNQDDYVHEASDAGTSSGLDISGSDGLSRETKNIGATPPSDYHNVEGLGEMSSKARDYISQLQSHLSSLQKQLHEVKRENSALQMQHFVGEEKNDLLDYLRSLHPEKVAELSEPTFPGLHDIIHSVVHGLLATLSPKMHTKAPPQSESVSGATLDAGEDDCTELVENTSLHFQPLISVSRDYLARLLFWCMLLGHYLRGLEYRLELMHLFKISR